jgi:hypothetical protein
MEYLSKFTATAEALAKAVGDWSPPSPRLRRIIRGVAQLASVLAWGASGRPFESDHPDKTYQKLVGFSFYGLAVVVTLKRDHPDRICKKQKNHAADVH